MWTSLRKKRERGLASTEVAVLFPVVFVLMFLFVQMAFYLHASHVAGAAAERGAEAGSLYGISDPGGTAVAAAASFLAASGAPASASANATLVPGGGGHAEVPLITVTVESSAVSLIPGFDFDISVEASLPVETYIEISSP